MKSIPLRQWEAQAYAAGKLTQLRRVVRPQPWLNQVSQWLWEPKKGTHMALWPNHPRNSRSLCNFDGYSPYGTSGDNLALREAWCYKADDCGNIAQGYWYKADKSRPHIVRFDGDGFILFCKDGREASPWKSSATMPIAAVRWRPLIMDVHLERNEHGVWEWVIDIEGIIP